MQDLTPRRGTLEPGYFDALYARNRDPWGFATSAYEKGKYRATLDALPRRHYRIGFEVGCSIGILTGDLATRCSALIAVDVADRALRAAAARCRDLRSVSFRRMFVPNELPNDSFDLILLSEVAYYWTIADLDRMANWMRGHLVAGGDLVLVHWRGETDYPISGDAAHQRLLSDTAFACLTDRVHTEYRLSVLRRH